MDQALTVLSLYLQEFPEILDEIDKLSAGKLGVITAVFETCVDGISYDPMGDITPERVRQLVGAPAEDEELAGWRQPFYEAFKASRENPQA